MLILNAQYNDNNTTLVSIITAKLFTFNYHNKRITTMRMQEKTTRRVEQMPAPSSEQAAQSRSRWWGRCRGCARWHEGGECNVLRVWWVCCRSLSIPQVFLIKSYVFSLRQSSGLRLPLLCHLSWKELSNLIAGPALQVSKLNCFSGISGHAISQIKIQRWR